MTTICGVDGCKGGWIAITKNLDTDEITWHLRLNAEALFISEPVPEVFAIDIPIGLPDKGGRTCDLIARKLLGAKRGTSVFPAPIRPILEAKIYREACDIRFDIEAKKLSQQTWAILPKIRDVDTILRANPDLQLRVFEIHPEVCLYYLANEQPMRFNKKTPEGHKERMAVLEPLFGHVIRKTLKDKRALASADDDILDAFSALWTAECIAKGAALTLPANPPMDKYGLKMQMVAGPREHKNVEISYRPTTPDDLDLLADWNHQLIQDEGHRNPMTVLELRERMQGWLAGDYKAVIFMQAEQPVAYALYVDYPDRLYLRQLFVHRDHRRKGIGRAAVKILRDKVWPRDKRLTVEVLSTNTRAVAFWHAMGYRDYALELELLPE